MSSPSVLFVTPAWQRFDLTRLCLWQRRLACDSLLEAGIEATCLVIADDENLDIAREFGFETLDRPNYYLSRRFNDGYEFAGKEGFDYICPIGSDSWIDPKLLRVLTNNKMQISRNYAVVREDGRALAQLAMRTPFGFSCFTLPTRMLKRFKYRPCQENLSKGCDGSLYRALYGSLAQVPPVAIREISPLDVVAFRSEIQITPYQRLVRRHMAREYVDPFRRLRRRFPLELVRAAEVFHRERSMVAA